MKKIILAVLLFCGLSVNANAETIVINPDQLTKASPNDILPWKSQSNQYPIWVSNPTGTPIAVSINADVGSPTTRINCNGNQTLIDGGQSFTCITKSDMSWFRNGSNPAAYGVYSVILTKKVG